MSHLTHTGIVYLVKNYELRDVDKGKIHSHATKWASLL